MSARILRPAMNVGLLLATSMCLVSAAPAIARAQSPEADAVAQRPYRAPQSPRASHLGVRGFASFELDGMTAAHTFDAVLGTSQLRAPGGGGEVLGLWHGLFVRVEASATKKTGSRVVVVDRQATSLGIPLTVEMQPVGFGGGWRGSFGRRRQGGVYLGALFVHLVYRETSTFAGANENVNTTFNGAAAFGGFDVRLWKMIVAGGEAQYRTFPKAIGTAGVSQAFGETDLGGGVVRGLIGFRF